MIGAIFKGFHGALSADGTITGYVGERIYAMLAPLTDSNDVAVDLPYIVLSLAAGGDANRTPKDELDVDVDVKAIAATALEAQTIADTIRSTLHRSDLTLEGGWNTYDLEHSTPFIYQDTLNGRQYWHAGGSYRLRAVKEG